MYNVIGQKPLKQQAEIFRKSFAKNSFLPFFLFTAERGAGKTHIARQLASMLIDSQGRERPLIEVNASSIKNVDSFLEIWYPKMRDENAYLFIDECHLLSPKVQNALLSICEKSRNPVRTYKHEKDEGQIDYHFDFRDYCIGFATTDHQKMVGPLKDRLAQLTISEYSPEELWEIFVMNVETDINKEVKDDVISIFRGHPRSCVALAESIDMFANASDYNEIDSGNWSEFRNIMQIFDYGINETEAKIIKIIGEFGPQSLTDLSAKTSLSKAVIQQEWENYLKKVHLITVDTKRKLTSRGHELYRAMFCA